jgi:hypothetical protein
MPVLSYYEGYSELSFGLFKNELDPNDHKLYRFPYTYSNNLFANSFPREKFINDVFELALKTLDVNLQDCKLYATGFLSAPELSFDVAGSFSLASKMPHGGVYISSQVIATEQSTYSMLPVSVVDEDPNFRVNLDLYHNIIYYDSRDIVLKDSVIRSLINIPNYHITAKDLIITGDRLREFYVNEALSYLLIFDLIKTSGVYHLKIDLENLLPHTISLDSLSIDYPSIGTLINIPGKVECLYETEVGTHQLFDLEADTLFILPLDSDATGRIVAKSSEVTIDEKVVGGKLGVIIDTRDKPKKVEFKEVYLNNIKQSIKRI